MDAPLSRVPMSALGHLPTFGPLLPMSAVTPKADIQRAERHVRSVPIGDIAPAVGKWPPRRPP